MKTAYKHLSVEERDKLAVLRSQGKSLRAIAAMLGRSHSSLVRELKRNAPPVHQGYYLPHKAHGRATARRRVAVRRERLKEPRIRAYVTRQLINICINNAKLTAKKGEGHFGEHTSAIFEVSAVGHKKYA